MFYDFCQEQVKGPMLMQVQPDRYIQQLRRIIAESKYKFSRNKPYTTMINEWHLLKLLRIVFKASLIHELGRSGNMVWRKRFVNGS